jgi:hypothetical protein
MKSSNLTKYLRGGAAGAVLLFVLPAAAYAAPVDGVAKALANPVSAGAAIEKVAYGRCSWRHGVRYCRRSAERPRVREYGSGYGYDYGAPRAEFYPTGSEAWWQAMEREGRTGIPRR